jgi:PST family polysaccharide transporter
MIQIKKIISNHAKIVENFFSLSILNVTNYIFPIILIPYLVRVLGAEYYGKYIFASTIIHYFYLFIQYGFDLSATKEIALIRENKQIVNEIYSSVMFIRVLFNILGILLMMFLCRFIPMMRNDSTLFLLGCGIFIGQSITPIWLFQGIEQMKYITIVNFFSRAIGFALIFILIKSATDYKYVLFLQSLGFISGAIISLIIVHKHVGIRFIKPSLEQIKQQLQKGWHIFLSTIGMNFYRESNIFILGILTNYTTVGYYAPAEKIVKAIQSFASPFVTALFPSLSRTLSKKDDKGSIAQYKRIGKSFSIILLLITILLFLTAKIFLNIYLGENFDKTIIDLRILSFVILFGGMNYYYGIAGLVNLGYANYFSKAVWISGIASILICTITSHYLKDVGAAIAMLSAEIILFIIIISKYIKNKILDE